jgi:hypothetical protein
MIHVGGRRPCGLKSAPDQNLTSASLSVATRKACLSPAVAAVLIEDVRQLQYRNVYRAARAAIAPDTDSPGRRFASDADIMRRFIRADKTADFEATVVAGSICPKQQS